MSIKKHITLVVLSLILCMCIIVGFASCASKKNVGEADSKINTVEEQVAAINASITDLKSVDAALDNYIKALEAADSATATVIAELKTQDTALSTKISALEEAVKSLATMDWANATFATLEQYSTLQIELASIKTSLDGLLDKELVEASDLSKAIETSEAAMKTWVNDTLAAGYYNIAEIDAKLLQLTGQFSNSDNMLADDIADQAAALEAAKVELTEAYNKAITDAIETNNGLITKQISAAIEDALAKVDLKLAVIDNAIAAIQKDIAEIKDSIASIEDQIANINTSIGDLEAVDTALNKLIENLGIKADDLQAQLDSNAAADAATKKALEDEITNIKSLISELQAKDVELKKELEDNVAADAATKAALEKEIADINNLINELKNKDTDLQAQLDSNAAADAATKKALEDEIASIKTALSELQAKDAELDAKIADLKNYVDSQLSDTKDWAENTFATLDKYNQMQVEINAIKVSLQSILDMDLVIKSELTTAISNCEASMKLWVNETLADGYYDIAEIDAKLNTLKSELEDKDNDLADAIAAQVTALEAAKTELTNAYKAAITTAIETNNGLIDTKISAAVLSAKAEIKITTDAIQALVNALTGRVDDLENKVDGLEDAIADLQTQINCNSGKHIPGTYNANNDVTHSYVCTACGNTVVERHTFVAGACACGFEESNVTLPEVSDPVEIPKYDVTQPENVGDSAVHVTIPAEVVNNLPSNITSVSVGYSEPVLDSVNNKITFTAVELVDQNGDIIDLAGNTVGNLTVTLSVSGFADGTEVAIYHDGVLMGYAEVVDGAITYEVAHLCEITLSKVVYVSTFEQLQEAVNCGSYVILANNIQATDNAALNIPADTSVCIDLNGNTYTSKDGGSGKWMAIYVSDGAELVIEDSVGTGKIISSCYGVYVKVGAKFTMNGGALNVSGNGAYDMAVVLYNGAFVMNDGSIDSKFAVWASNYYRDNNENYADAPDCSVTIAEGCTVNSTGYTDVELRDAPDTEVNVPESVNIYKDVAYVDSAEALVKFLDGGIEDLKIALTNDIVMTESVYIKHTVVLDLNGYDLDASGIVSDRPFYMYDGASFTVNAEGSTIIIADHGFLNVPVNTKNVSIVINGGTFSGTSKYGAFIRLRTGNENVNVTLNNVNYSDDANNGYIISSQSFDAYGTLVVNGGSYSANYGFQIYGLKAEINGVTITTAGTAVEATGNDTTSLSDVTVVDCKITVAPGVTVERAPAAAVAASHGGAVTVTNTTISGNMKAVYYVYATAGTIVAENNTLENVTSTYFFRNDHLEKGVVIIDGVQYTTKNQLM